jgi:hypothetical protein
MGMGRGKMKFCQFQQLSIGSYFKLLNQDDVYQKVRFISDFESDNFEKHFLWKTLAINTDSGMGCYLKDDRVIRKVELAQAICV